MMFINYEGMRGMYGPGELYAAAYCCAYPMQFIVGRLDVSRLAGGLPRTARFVLRGRGKTSTIMR
jgi:hypothetical protein